MKMKEIVLVTLLIVLVFSVAIGVGVFQIKQEQRAFNKYRSPDTPEATFWDAFGGDLRVNTN
jgi:hypothetical protein